MTRCTRREWLAAAPGAVLIAGAGSAASIACASAPFTVRQTAGAASSAARTSADAPAAAGASADPPAAALHAGYPGQHPDRVREVVGASHRDIDRVRELVEASPSLAKAAWDWGFGDWETALGAASHVGRPDIAELLISHGARPNLFTFAMMGKLQAVRACIEAMPGVQRVPGPHGITLLAHARAGGEQAAEVARYLESLGDADPVPTDLPLSDEQKQAYLGSYRFGDGEDEVFEVALDRRGRLSMKRVNQAARVLNRVEEHDFAPAGAPAVRIRFRVEQGRGVAIAIHDAGAPIAARRIDG